MSYKITNNTTKDINILEKLVGQFYPYAHKTMGFSKPTSIVFSSDVENGQNPLGKTAHYNPNINEITVYIDYRHPKDIMRSLSHELVHHTQNCRGEFADGAVTEEGYAQTNPHLREMEREAYELGNLCFRDWENQYNLNLQENKKMNEETLKKEIKEMLEEILAEEEVEEGFKSKAYNRDPESEEEKKRKEEAEKKKALDDFGAGLAGAPVGHAGHGAGKRDVSESDEVDLEESEETELEETEEIEERTKTTDTAQGRDAGGRRVKDPVTGVRLNEDDEEVVEESEDTESIEENEDEEINEWWNKSLYTRLCESWLPKNKKEVL